MVRTIRYVSAAGLALGLTTATALMAGSAGAQSTPQLGVPQVHGRATITIVAAGLNTPRGVLYDARHHRVLVAEAGTFAGDTGKCGIGEGGASLCFGKTGSVLQYSTRTGHSHELLTGLPSEAVSDGSAVLGLEDLSLYRHTLRGIFGLLGTPATRKAEGAGARALGQVAVLSRPGHARPVGDIAKFEIHKYGIDQESDPYGLVTGRYGTVVANAGGHAVFGNIGGNDLLLVRHHKVTSLAAFPQRVPKANPKDIVESVPTTVVQGPDGAFYVGELTGFPYYKGEARVWRVVPGHKPTIFAEGFTNIISIAFDPSGRLIVLEIAKKGLQDPDQVGALIRVGHNGHKTLLASTGLTNPGGVAVVNDHVFYVTNFTASTGGTGQLLKITVHG
jgi:hypothetical protein